MAVGLARCIPSTHRCAEQRPVLVPKVLLQAPEGAEQWDHGWVPAGLLCSYQAECTILFAVAEVTPGVSCSSEGFWVFM